jgi:peptidoglycan/xylan/chitin deacetylase (PgdA/CDA1 family)
MADFKPSNVPPGAEEPRPVGMDHAHYSFRIHSDATALRWPDDARVALTVTLVLDYWEVNPPPAESADPRIVSPLGKFFPDWLTWSQREYGARVGIFRVLRVLDEFGLIPSVALGTVAATRYPELVDELTRRDACFLAHGDYATRRLTSRLDRADETARIVAARDTITRLTGSAPAGWCGQDYTESWDTPALLAEAGFTYTTDWSNDDRPYMLGPYDGRSLLAFPAQAEWSDLECMWLRRVSPPVWSDCLTEAFHVLRDEGGGVFNLTLHPFVTGQAHRIRYLRDALRRIMGAPGIWRATTDQVAEVARRAL